MYLCLAMATVRGTVSSPQAPEDAKLDDVLEPVLTQLRKLFQDFSPLSP
jgi:hypothetical protein